MLSLIVSVDNYEQFLAFVQPRPCLTQSASSSSAKMFLPPRSLGGYLVLLGENLAAYTPRQIFFDSTFSSAKIFYFLSEQSLSKVPRRTANIGKTTFFLDLRETICDEGILLGE